MRRVASMPFMLGMAISITTTSGECSSASATASRPSAASPDHGHVGLLFEQRAQAVANDGVVVSQQYADWRHRGSLHSRSRAEKLAEGVRRQSAFRGRAANRFAVAAQPAHALFHAQQAQARAQSACRSRLRRHAPGSGRAVFARTETSTVRALAWRAQLFTASWTAR